MRSACRPRAGWRHVAGAACAAALLVPGPAAAQTCPGPCTRSSFAGAPHSYVVADGPVAAAAADFDRDGRADLAVATANDSFVRVRRGVGGDFVVLADVGPFVPPPRGIATADFDFDGQADLVAALGGAGSGWVQFILRDGTGAFAIAGSLAAGTNTAAVAVGDFDGNGTPDVAAVSEGDGSVWVFVGNGAGSFTPLAGNPVLSGLTTPRALVAADLTGDGLADIAVAESGASAVHVLRASVDGGGTLTFARVTPVAGIAVGQYPESIAAGQLDGDGRLDLVTADNGSSRVSVILRDSGGGFADAVAYATGANPRAVALVDLTGDGWLDVAVATSTTRTLTVFTNNGAGTGTFSKPLDGDYPVRGFPRAITPIDADGDGHLDLAVACQTADSVVVLLSRPPALNTIPHAGVGTRPRAALAADLDGDGDMDLAIANLAGNAVSVLLNRGAGTFDDALTFGPVDGPESIVAGDFNGDGRPDLALSAPLASPRGVRVLLGTATPGSYSVLPVVGVGSATAVPNALAVGDFDRDGFLDLAVCDKTTPGQVHILRGDGSGGFTASASVGVGAQPTAIVAADFDRDGDLDLAIANEGADDVQILTNTGGSFAVTAALTLPGTDVNPLSIAAADFDGDGDADLAVAAFLGDRIHVYRNDGGTFTSNPVLSLDAPFLLSFVTAADVNLDGRPDLLAVATGLSVFRGRPSGLDFEAPETVMAGWLPRAAVVADFNRDGWPDVAVANEDSNDVSLLISTPCQARRLEVVAQPPACEMGLAPYAPAAEVRAYDDGGNLATCTGGTVVPSIVPGTGATGAVLGGPGAGGLPLASGVASFTGLTIDRPGRRYRLQFSLGSLPSVRSRSFTLGPALQILGTPSMCSGSSSTFSAEGSYDQYVWRLDTAPIAYTPTLTLRNPPVTGEHALALSARVDGCFLQSPPQTIFGGDLQSTTLTIEPIDAYTVCVDCIGGTVKPFDLGGGPPTSRQWGYRTVSGTGAVTDMPGETGGTYVLKGASFPGPGVYYVVVRTRPACGTETLSQELTVRVLTAVPGDEVLHLAVTSRGSSTGGGQNRIQWVNATSEREVRIRWNKAPAPDSPCVPPAAADAGSDGVHGLTPPLPTLSAFDHTDDGTPPGLDLDTTYCYSLFVQTATGWSRGRTVQARPFDAESGPVKWAYSTGATAVVPPVVGYPGILVMSNDGTVHSVTRGGANGGYWPSGWAPYPLTGVAHSRSPVVPFVDTSPVFPGESILFVADDAGDVHAVEAADGRPAWTAPRSLGKPVVGAPGGLFTQYRGVADLIIVGTRDTGGFNELHGLAVGTGALVGSAFTWGGTIGPISGSPAIDSATQLVYFTSRSYSGGDTVWCVQVDGTTPFNRVWSRNLGDVDGSPVLRNGRVYFGNTEGVVYSLDAATGLDERTFVTGDGPVKGFVFPDRRNDDLIFATRTTVWSISDAGGTTMAENWRWTDSVNGLNPSVVLYRPQTNYVYVGSRNGRLYELDFTSAGLGTPPTSNVLILGDGRAQAGAPSLDIGVVPPDVNPDKKLLVVGSESGTLYGVEVPF